MRTARRVYFVFTLMAMLVLSGIAGFIWNFVRLNTGITFEHLVIRPLMIALVLWVPFFLAPVFAYLTLDLRRTLFDVPLDGEDWIDAAHHILLLSLIAGFAAQFYYKIDGTSFAEVASLLAFQFLPILMVGSIYAICMGMRSDHPLASNAQTDARMILTSTVVVARQMAERRGGMSSLTNEQRDRYSC